eukprot:CAMPEP_0170497514 /NCGR_PEP_ID=MMETSP0208-20121228/24915_1 /TAXON_ID=197538 /ORGANISM="Strombidium inclinatum, Strain S3" /LENGTH=141 /DNA_ID=CAMNT_0010774347 /DNA_START=253 /DNA_END=678 /DNA_ORIENTATION=-
MDHVKESILEISALISKEANENYGGNSEKIYLSGFSQGSSLAHVLSMMSNFSDKLKEHPENLYFKTDVPSVGGAISTSGVLLPQFIDTLGLIFEPFKLQKAKLKQNEYFGYHGGDDFLYDYMLVKQSFDQLWLVVMGSEEF